MAKPTIKQWAAARAKAFGALLAATTLSYLATALVDPSTKEQVEGVLPEQYKWAAPVIIGILTALVVHHEVNVPVPATAPETISTEDEPEEEAVENESEESDPYAAQRAAGIDIQ